VGQHEEGRRRNTGGLSSLSDVVMAHFGQIPSGHRNDFHLEQKRPWKGNQPSRRAFSSDLFVIPVPRTWD
jgi:hypothetical protein